MEPFLILALGLVSLVGQLQNYGIGQKQIKENPHLKDIRVRRHIESQPYALKIKNFEKLQADFEPYALKNKDSETPKVKTQTFDVKDKDIEKVQADTEPEGLKDKDNEKLHDVSQYYAQDVNDHEKPAETQPNSIEDKDDRKLRDLPEEAISVKSILKGDKNIRKRKRRSYSAVSYQQSQYQMAASGSKTNAIDNTYGTKNYYPYSSVGNNYNNGKTIIGYNTETTKYNGVKTVTEAYYGYNGNNYGYNGNTNGYNDNNNGYGGNNNGFNDNHNGYSHNNAFNGTYWNNTSTHTYTHINGRVSTTTPRIVPAQVIVNFGCPQFMKNVSIFGKKICVTDENIQDVDETDYM